MTDAHVTNAKVTDPVGRHQKPGELIFAYILFTFSLLVCFFAIEISGFTSMSAPGSVPMLAATFLFLSALANLKITSNLSTQKSNTPSFSTLITPKIWIFFTVSTLVYILVINQIGFIIASGLFLFISILVLYKKGPLLAFFISTNALAIIYVIFRVTFKVILPEANL